MPAGWLRRVLPWPRARRPRILALLAFRNEMRFLPGYFENVARQVDGIVALDDGSIDGSTQLVASRPSVLQVLRSPSREPHCWDDSANHRRLVEAAWLHQPDWLLGVDADERLEIGFRRRADAAIERAEREGHAAYYVTVRELWNAPDTFRADGIWGQKRSARFFRARRDHEFHEQRLHCHWAPLNSREDGDFPVADLVIYHLRMLREEDRRARQARYRALDPERRWQPMGYDYMTDERGLQLERIPPGRSYRPLGR